MSIALDTALFLGACSFFTWVATRLFLDKDDHIEEDDWQEVEIELQPNQRQAKLINENINE